MLSEENISRKDTMLEIQRKVLAMSPDKFKEIENTVSPYTPRPQAEQINFDDSQFYNFLVFDTETNTVNAKYAEICQLSAVDYSSSNTFSEYVLPTCDIDYCASEVNNLTIEFINSERKLLKNGVVVPTLPVNEAITKFESYISQSIERAKAKATSTTNKHVLTVLIGHNIAAFDARIILRNGGKGFADKLQSMNVWFADSLTLFRALVKCKYPSLKNSDDTFPKLNLACLYQALFQQSYVAHDALEDAIALRKILFSSRLELTAKTIVDNSRLVSTNHVSNDMEYLDHRYRNMQSFTRIMYNKRTNTGLKKGMIEKISGSGLTYKDLQNVYKRHGKDGLVAILSRPPSSSSSKKPRVTQTERILTAIIEHFQISAQFPSSLLASRISRIPSVESPGSFNPPSNLNLGSQESPGKIDLSDKKEQLYVKKLKQLSVYTEPLRKMIAKMQNEEDVANKDSKILTKLKRFLGIIGNPKARAPYRALLEVEDVLCGKLPIRAQSLSLLVYRISGILSAESPGSLNPPSNLNLGSQESPGKTDLSDKEEQLYVEKISAQSPSLLASIISGIPSVESPGSFNPPSNLNLGSQESPSKTDLSDKEEQLYVEKISAQSPSLLPSRISGIPSVESPGSFNPPSNLNLGSQESPDKTDLSDKEEQLYVEKLMQLSVYTEPLRKMIAKMQNDEDVANKDSKNLTNLKRLLSILGNPKERVPYQALLNVEDVLCGKLPISAQFPSSLLASRISGIPSVESPGSFNPPSNLNLGSEESPGKNDLSDKEEQLYVEKLKQLSVYTEPLRKMIAKMQNDGDVAKKDSKNLTKLKRSLSILRGKKRVSYQALLKVEDDQRRIMLAVSPQKTLDTRLPRKRPINIVHTETSEKRIRVDGGDSDRKQKRNDKFPPIIVLD